MVLVQQCALLLGACQAVFAVKVVDAHPFGAFLRTLCCQGDGGEVQQGAVRDDRQIDGKDVSLLVVFLETLPVGHFRVVQHQRALEVRLQHQARTGTETD